jgi:hypothetical protein
MKHVLKILLLLWLLALLASCQKQSVHSSQSANLPCIELDAAPDVLSKQRPKTRPIINSNYGVVLVDFNGHVTRNTSWNTSGDIIAADAGLDAVAQDSIFRSIARDLTPYRVIVTTDELIYNAAPANQRQRVVITRTWEWYGQVGGVAYNGSYFWSSEEPAFVFSSLLQYRIRDIARAASHELGHTFTLRHQARYDAFGNKLEEYHSGDALSAPIMGVPYYAVLAIWWKGYNPFYQWQDDDAILTQKLGKK